MKSENIYHIIYYNIYFHKKYLSNYGTMSEASHGYQSVKCSSTILTEYGSVAASKQGISAKAQLLCLAAETGE